MHLPFIIISAATSVHPVLLLAVYIVLTVILRCLLLCLSHQCLSLWWVFCFPCSLHDFVMTNNLLWIGLVQACILSWLCIGEFLITCIEVSAVMFLYVSWPLPPVVFELLLYFHLWQSTSGEMTLHGYCCVVLHLIDSTFHLCSVVSQFPILLHMNLFLHTEVLFHYRTSCKLFLSEWLCFVK